MDEAFDEVSALLQMHGFSAITDNPTIWQRELRGAVVTIMLDWPHLRAFGTANKHDPHMPPVQRSVDLSKQGYLRRVAAMIVALGDI